MSNMTDLWLSGAIFSTSKYSKTRFWPGGPGLRPGPRWGAYDAPPSPLDAFSVSISASKLLGGAEARRRRLRRLGFQAPQHKLKHVGQPLLVVCPRHKVFHLLHFCSSGKQYTVT